MSRFSNVVRAHHKDSQGILVAEREPCISIAYDEKRNAAGRSFRIVPPDKLNDLTLKDSWCMGILLCPDDTTLKVARWFTEGGHEAHRVIFYLHHKTDARSALAAWHHAELSIHATWTIKSWRDLHKHFGNHWNNQVFLDHRHLHEG